MNEENEMRNKRSFEKYIIHRILRVLCLFTHILVYN